MPSLVVVVHLADLTIIARYNYIVYLVLLLASLHFVNKRRADTYIKLPRYSMCGEIEHAHKHDDLKIILIDDACTFPFIGNLD